MAIMNVTVRFKSVEGFAVISRDEDRLMNYIDDNGIILSPNLWFEWATPFTKDGYGIVQRVFDHTWNFIDRQGKILSPNMWFKGVGTFINDVAYVYQNIDSWNYINKKVKYSHPICGSNGPMNSVSDMEQYCAMTLNTTSLTFKEIFFHLIYGLIV